MLIVKPFIFKRFFEIIFGFSTKIGPDAIQPYYFNLSYSVGDEKEIVDSNRKLFFREVKTLYHVFAEYTYNVTRGLSAKDGEIMAALAPFRDAGNAAVYYIPGGKFSGVLSDNILKPKQQ